jgi:hypothetical protein
MQSIVRRLRMLERYEKQAEEVHRRLLAVQVALQEQDGLSEKGKAAVLERARNRYAVAVEELQEAAAVVVEEAREALEREQEEARLARWASLRETLGAASASLLMFERVKGLSVSEAAELYEQGDEWLKSIVALAVEEPVGGTSGEALSEALAYERIADGEVRRSGGEELREREREVARAERIVEELDVVGSAERDADATGVEVRYHPAMQAAVSDLSDSERREAERFVGRAVAEEQGYTQPFRPEE